MTRSEVVLQALLAALAPLESATRDVYRDRELPTSIPSDGVVNLLSGDPGDPEELLGGDGPYVYQHQAEIEIHVQNGDPIQRALKFDALAEAVGAALDADPILGGLISGMSYGAPDSDVARIEGEASRKAGVIGVTLEYQSETRI